MKVRSFIPILYMLLLTGTTASFAQNETVNLSNPGGSGSGWSYDGNVITIANGANVTLTGDAENSSFSCNFAAIKYI